VRLILAQATALFLVPTPVGALTSRIAVFDGMTRRTREQFGGSFRAAAALFGLQVPFVKIKHLVSTRTGIQAGDWPIPAKGNPPSYWSDSWTERFFCWRNFSRAVGERRG